MTREGYVFEPLEFTQQSRSVYCSICEEDIEEKEFVMHSFDNRIKSSLHFSLDEKCFSKFGKVSGQLYKDGFILCGCGG